MRHYFTMLVILVVSTNAFAQDSIYKTPINTKFAIHLDSIEQNITVNKWGIDSNYYLHYKIVNLSNDTLTYITNSCFYYNHYSLRIGQLEFDLNPSGGCTFNEITPHSLAPGESFSNVEWITARNLHSLLKGEYNVKLSIPIVKDGEKIFRVDGREFVENANFLIYNKQTKIIETYNYIKKRKKKRT